MPDQSRRPNRTSPAAAPPAEPDLTYEQARQELIEVVQKLESGGVPLAESMQLWERGEQLANLCQQFLDGAKARVAAARQQPTAEPTGTAELTEPSPSDADQLGEDNPEATSEQNGPADDEDLTTD
jgi:exodeoxyribonuclease VII small subunit